MIPDIPRWFLISSLISFSFLFGFGVYIGVGFAHLPLYHILFISHIYFLFKCPEQASGLEMYVFIG